MENQRYIKVEVSARHCHLQQSTLDALFGQGFDLDKHVRRFLSQKKQYVSDLRLTILTVGADRREHRIAGVSILGPVRGYDQVEISLTDARQLAVTPPVTISGKLEHSVPVTLIAPDDQSGRELGRVDLPRGLIVAQRHVHCNPRQAKLFGLSDGDVVKVSVESALSRHTIYDDIVVRIHPTFDLALHLDTDEGNAAGIQGPSQGLLER